MNYDQVARDKRLIPIWEKVQRGERLTLEDGVIMFKTPDILFLGTMAHFAQSQIDRKSVV